MPATNHEQNGSPAPGYGEPEEYADRYSDDNDALLSEANTADSATPVNKRTRAAARGYRPAYERTSPAGRITQRLI